MTTPRHVTVTNVFGPLNRGDFELFQQLVDLLTADPTIRVAAIARDPEGCRTHFPGVEFHAQPGAAAEIPGKIGRVVALLRTLLVFLAARIAIAERGLPAPQRAALAAIRGADLVIACPGGYLTSSSWSFFPQVAQIDYAARRGKRLWLAPMSIGPAHRMAHRVLLGRALRAADRVYVRESWSERFCQRLGVNATRSADLALRPARTWLANGTNGAPSANGIHRAPSWITATVVRWDFGDAPDPVAARDRYHSAMATALDAVSAEYGLPIKLLLQVDNDRAVTETVASALQADHEIVRVDTPGEYRDILARSRLMIGSRFHSAIFAMSVGCPTVVVSYLPKGRYMMEDMGLAPLVHDIGDLRSDDLIASQRLLDDPSSPMRARARAAILEQTDDAQNPFVTDLRAVLGSANGVHHA